MSPWKVFVVATVASMALAVGGAALLIGLHLHDGEDWSGD